MTTIVLRGLAICCVCAALLSCLNPAGTGSSDGTFTVTYDPNGATSGTVPRDSNTYDQGATVTVLDNTGALERTGFVLIGWNLSSSGEGLAYAPGDTFTHDGSDLVLFADWRQSGSLDSSFDPGTGADDGIAAAAIQSDGKILIAGLFSSYDGTARNGIARLNPDGSLDTDFDPGTGIGGVASPGIYDLLIDTSGKILIGGNFTTYDGTSRVRLARLNPDGSLDSTFQPGAGPNDQVLSMALQANGKIVIGGSFSSYAGTDVDYVARLETDGDLDTTFAPDPEGADNTVSDVLVQDDGKIVIGGSFQNYEQVAQSNLARINPSDGGLDTTFDTGSGPNNVVRGLAVQDDGKLLIGGLFAAYNGTLIDKIARVNPGGSLDDTFDPSDGPNNAVYAFLPLPDNKLMIGGPFTAFDGNPINGIARLDGSASRDPGFAANPGTNASDPYVADIVHAGDHSLIILGAFTSYNGTERGRIARIWR